MYKTTNDSPVDAAVAVAPINNTLHSPFSNIDVCLNDVNVSSATTTHPYREYIETHFNYGTDAKKSRLQAAMNFIDDNLTVSNPIPDLIFSKKHGTKEKTWDMYCKAGFRYDWSATRRCDQSEQIYVEWCDR